MIMNQRLCLLIILTNINTNDCHDINIPQEIDPNDIVRQSTIIQNNNEISYFVMNDGYWRTDPCELIGDNINGLVIDIDNQHRRLNPYNGNTYLWPNGTIPYKIDRSLTNETNSQSSYNKLLKLLNQVNTHLKTYTPSVQIRPKLPTDTHYVLITYGSGCSSYVGNIPSLNPQPLTLKNISCYGHDTILHEFLHAFGLYHTHTRKDRDEHVIVNFDNIRDGYEHNFNIRNKPICGNYNCSSVMHYSPKAFAIDSSINTISAINPNICTPGSGRGLSNQDMVCLDLLYGTGSPTTVSITPTMKPTLVSNTPTITSNKTSNGICMSGLITSINGFYVYSGKDAYSNNLYISKRDTYELILEYYGNFVWGIRKLDKTGFYAICYQQNVLDCNEEWKTYDKQISSWVNNKDIIINYGECPKPPILNCDTTLIVNGNTCCKEYIFIKIEDNIYESIKLNDDGMPLLYLTFNECRNQWICGLSIQNSCLVRYCPPMSIPGFIHGLEPGKSITVPFETGNATFFCTVPITQ